MRSGYRVLKISSSGVDNDILRSRSIMALGIVLPRSYALAYKREAVLATTLGLIHSDVELHHLARRIGKRLILRKLIRYATYSDVEECSASRNFLRHYDSTPFIVHLRGNGSRRLHVTCHFHGSVCHAYACLTRQIGDKHCLIHAFPFALGEALALEQLHASTRHTVSQQQTQGSTGGCYIAQLTPKEVARLITAHLSVGSGSALVTLHIKSIVVDAYRFDVWIVAIYVYMGMEVFPVNIIVRIPFTVGFIVSVAYIVGTVAALLQRTRCASLIINNVDAHSITVAKATIVDTRHSHLVYFA